MKMDKSLKMLQEKLIKYINRNSIHLLYLLIKEKRYAL